MAHQSSSSLSSSTSLSAIPTTPIFNPVNVHSLVTVKLTKDNYLLWRAQVTPYLRGQQLFGHVDGTIIAPPKFITTSAPSSTTPVQIENPAYSQWFTKDQVILSILVSSLSEGILSQVINCTTSQEVWSGLERMFSSTSTARTMHLRSQLSSITKGNSSVTEYFQRVKTLADTLAAIGQPLPAYEIASSLLNGLDSSYDPLVASISTHVDPLTLEDIYSHLLSFE